MKTNNQKSFSRITITVKKKCLFIEPSIKSEVGFDVASEPIIAIPLASKDETIGNILKYCYSFMNQPPITDEERLESTTHELTYTLAGAKGWGSFAQRAKQVSLFIQDGIWEFLPSEYDQGFMVLDHDQGDIYLPEDSSDAEIGQYFRKALALCPDRS